MFKRMDMRDMIQEEAGTKNPFKIFSIKRKIDPVIIAALEQSRDDKSTQMIRDYIWSLNKKEMEFDSLYGKEYSI